MLHLGIALMCAVSLTAIALWWRDHSRWLEAEDRALNWHAASLTSLEAANSWRDAYFSLKRRLQPPAPTVCAPLYHSPKGLDDDV